MKRLVAILTTLAMLTFLVSAAFAEALPVESPVEKELNTEKTFADVVDTEEILVAGPDMSKPFIENYLREHPEIVWDMFDCLNIIDMVIRFTEIYPDAEDFNTYDAETGKVKELTGGYCVTFHQNLKADDPYGGYTAAEYAAMIVIAMEELGTNSVNIGYFGNPEISFVCMDKEVALRFAVRHNQNSIYCVSTDETLYNPKWNSELNPIRGVE